MTIYAKQPSGGSGQITTIGGIDLTGGSGTAFTLYTVPTAKKAIVLDIALEVTDGSGVTLDARASVGTSVGASNIFPVDELTNLRVVNDIWFFGERGKSKVVTAGNPIILNLARAASATTLTITARVFGSVV